MTLPYKPSDATQPMGQNRVQGPSGAIRAAQADSDVDPGTPPPQTGVSGQSAESALGPFSRKRRHGPGLVFGKPTRRVKP